MQEDDKSLDSIEQDDAFMKKLGLDFNEIEKDLQPDSNESDDQFLKELGLDVKDLEEESQPGPEEWATPVASADAPVDSTVIEQLRSLGLFIRPKISADGYTAAVEILKNGQDAIFDIDHVKQFLERYNITYGLKDDGMKEVIELVKSGPSGKEVVVAKGSPLEEGKDGIADYKFQTKLIAGKMDENKIDFKERGLINNVREGQILAKITTHIPGKPGMRIDGEVVDPRPVESVKIPNAGINVSMFKKGNVYTYTAMIDGHARLVFQEMQVYPDLIITGDLDYTKGNIDFVGNIAITGTLKSGFKINAGGDVVIGGDVEPDAVIQAKNDITVKKTINCGKNTGKIVAGGSVSANRIVNSLIESKKDVFVKDQIVESVIYCEGKFATTFAKIVGCEIEAIAGIFVNNVGLEDGNAKNKLYAGKSVKVAERLEEIKSELERIKNEQALLAKGVTAQKEKGYHGKDFEKLDLNEQERIKRLGVARSKHAKMLKESKDELQKEQAELAPRMKENPSAQIKINGFIYPTCYIRIGEREINVVDEKKGACVLDSFGE